MCIEKPLYLRLCLSSFSASCYFCLFALLLSFRCLFKHMKVSFIQEPKKDTLLRCHNGISTTNFFHATSQFFSLRKQELIKSDSSLITFNCRLSFFPYFNLFYSFSFYYFPTIYCKYRHSMAMGNLNKSKETKPRTTPVLKIAPKRTIFHKN